MQFNQWILQECLILKFEMFWTIEYDWFYFAGILSKCKSFEFLIKFVKQKLFVLSKWHWRHSL